MYQSAFMVEQEIQLRRQKAYMREAEQRRWVQESATRSKNRWPKLADLFQFTFCTVRSIWRMAC